MTISRRTLLTTAAATAVAATSIVSRQTAQAQSRYPSTNLVRGDVNTLAPDDPMIVSYRKAVGKMRKLPDSNPLSWEHQATIHFNYCPHGNWFFLPWHRAYVHQFEDIIRKVSGNKDFALPYWDWTRNPRIPRAFWGADNPLNHDRVADRNTSMPAEFVGEPVIRQIMEKTGFQQFASFKSSAPYNGTGGGTAQFEGSPHNNVHVTIGQDMVTFMSPRDPIFWLHHCNIDRIWASWNVAGNPNTNDPDLADFVFAASQPDRYGKVNPSQFVDPDGKAKEYKVRNMYATGPMGYEYDRLEDAPRTSFVMAARGLAFQNVSRSTVRGALTRTAAAGVALSTNLDVNQAQIDSVADAGRAKHLSRFQSFGVRSLPEIATASLTVRGLKAPTDPATAVRVFLNCDYLALDTPINDPHYVASAAFFLAGGHADGANQNGHGATFVFPLTETIDALQRAGEDLRGNLMPQIIAVNPDGSGAELEIDGELEVAIETVG